MQILIDRNGQRMGPYTPEQVNDYLAAGSLLPTDSAWHEGMPAWGPLNTVQGVVMPGAAPPPPEPAPPPTAPPPPAAGPPMAMGSICPQCNVTMQPGQVVCMNCGSHLHAMPSAGKKGAIKLVAIIGGGVLALALIAYFLVFKKDKGRNRSAGSNDRGKARVKCAANCGQIYKAMLGFGQDNRERLPWQLTPLGVRKHLDSGAPGYAFGLQQNRSLNEVNAHPNALQTAGVWGILAVKRELQTAKILHSPCDPARAKQNEQVQGNWNGYDTKTRGVSAELGNGTSYTLVRGADTQRSTSVLLVTRNWSGDNLGSGRWLGSDKDKGNGRTMAGLTYSQGQLVMMDGSMKQASNDDLGPNGKTTQAASQATGGAATGQTSLNIMRGAGL